MKIELQNAEKEEASRQKRVRLLQEQINSLEKDLLEASDPTTFVEDNEKIQNDIKKINTEMQKIQHEGNRIGGENGEINAKKREIKELKQKSVYCDSDEKCTEKKHKEALKWNKSRTDLKAKDHHKASLMSLFSDKTVTQQKQYT